MLYDIILIVVLLFYSPILVLSILKGKQERWWERFGHLDKELIKRFRNEKTIWIHAASVGETVVGKQVVDEIKKEFSDYRILFSTISVTGKKVALENINNLDGVIFLPLDLSFIVRRVVGLFKPELLILIETELWPNLIKQVHRHRGRIMVASGRIGDKSFKNYQRITPLLKRYLFMVDAFSMQSELDAERIIALGAPKDKVLISGNIKYDRDFSKNIVDKDALYRKLNINASTPVLVAGSTHANEEEQLLATYKSLKKHFPKLLMIIAPRYIDRTAEIKEVYSKQGIRAVSWSDELNEITQDAVVIVDTFGELAGLYQIATLVFVGGSLIPKGGHNILEPAAYGKAIFVGPHMFNFKEDTRYFLEAEALIQVNHAGELAEKMLEYLKDCKRHSEIGKKAAALIETNKGALRANLQQVNYLVTRRPKILVVRLSAIGDVIHALPAADAIKKSFPAAELNWLVEDRVADLVALNPNVDQIIVMPRKQWREIAQKSKWRALQAVVGFLNGLRVYNFDLVLDLHGFFKSAVPVGMTKASLRYGAADAGEGSRLFYNHTIKVPRESQHKVDRYRYLAERTLGFQAGQVSFSIVIGSRAKEKVAKLLAEHSLTGKRFVVINPYTTWKTKDWIIERYGELAERIKTELDFEVVFTGGPDERDGVEWLRKKIAEPVHNLAGLTNLEELAEVYRRAEVFIGGDTGPMHLAVAMNLPVVAIMGPTDPVIYGPYGDNHIVVRDDNLACLKCWKRKCPKNHECMTNVTVDQVLMAAQGMLGIVGADMVEAAAAEERPG